MTTNTILTLHQSPARLASRTTDQQCWEISTPKWTQMKYARKLYRELRRDSGLTDIDARYYVVAFANAFATVVLTER